MGTMFGIIMTLYLIGGFLFLVSLVAHVYVRIRLRPGPDSDLEEYHYEFEDQHPDYARYTKWLRVTTSGAAAGVLLLFLGLVF